MVVAEVVMGMRLMVGQGVRGRGVVDDVSDGHGGDGGDRVNRVNRVNRVDRVDRVDRMVAAVMGYDHIVVGGVVRRRGWDERVRGGRRDDRMD